MRNVSAEHLLWRGMIISMFLHVAAFVFMQVSIPMSVPKLEAPALKVRFVAPVKEVKKDKKITKVKKPEPARTQQSAAPREETVQKHVPKPVKKTATKVVKAPPPPPKKAPKVETKKKSAPRPEKLDKTPDKKPIVNDMKAELKETAKVEQDFLAALSFVENLEVSEKTNDAAPETAVVSGPSDDEIAALQSHIESVWLRPPGMHDADNLVAKVKMHISREGDILFHAIVESSGNSAYDESLLRAVKKAEPIPIPAGRYEAFKVMSLYFGKQ